MVAYLALFLALGGTAIAASQLGKNTVGTKQLKKNAVTAVKIKNGAVTGGKLADGSVAGAKLADGGITGTKIADGSLTGAKVADRSLTGKQVDATTLGTVPTAEQANSLPPPEPWHVVGAPGEPQFMNAWKDFEPESSSDSVAFYKDQIGIVHLRGRAVNGTATHMFNLPPGFRPAERKTIFPVVACDCGSNAFGVPNISGNIPNDPGNSGAVYVPFNATVIAFDGVTFRAES